MTADVSAQLHSVNVEGDMICDIRFVELAGSEQTSSAIMLWAKKRVYVCSGRAGGNERHLLFFVRSVEP